MTEEGARGRDKKTLLLFRNEIQWGEENALIREGRLGKRGRGDSEKTRADKKRRRGR